MSGSRSRENGDIAGVTASPGGAPTPSRTVPEAFAEQARRTPDAVAVSHRAQSRTYAELLDEVERLAELLRRRGVGPEDAVGVLLGRSVPGVVAYLAILEAGAVYLPLDPDLPAPRLAFMLEDSGADLVLTVEALRGRLPPGTKALLLDGGADPPARSRSARSAARPLPASAAYLMYTSGSTGRPKGVVVEHHSLWNAVAASLDLFTVGPGARILQIASVGFDFSLMGPNLALCSGGRLCLAGDAESRPGAELADLLRRESVTTLLMTTSGLAAMPACDLPELREIGVGGETCPRSLVDRWAPGRRFLNLYGPTEATIWCTFEECLPGTVPTIGRPIPNTSIWILDDRFEPVEDGTLGEIWIGGVAVARGYRNRPELTAERFVSLPVAGAGRLYRTGDRGRRRGDGRIELLGRLDDQVKVRGYRVEPGEVEARLGEHPAVDRAVVRGCELGQRGLELVAWLVPVSGRAVSVESLRRFLRETLPDYMVPSRFVTLAELPLTANGKVDRAALPPPGRARPDLAAAYAAPAGVLESTIAAVWEDVLGRDRVGVNDDFFALGGHSLLATRVLARVGRAFGVELPLGFFYANPTVASLACAVEDARRLTGPGERVAIRRRERAPGTPRPLSFAQESVWFLEQLHAGNTAYHAEVVYRLSGPLDVAALEASLAEIVRRHDIFRTSFTSIDGVPMQIVHPGGGPRLEEVDLSGFEGDLDAEVERRIAEEYSRPFDLSQPCLARWTLLRLGEDRHVLVQVEHHMVHDGWSMNVLLRELRDLYNARCRGEPSPLPEPELQFADFAEWQREWAASEEAARQLEYWRRRLAGSPGLLELPADHPRPALQRLTGTSRRLTLEPELAEGLRERCRQEGVSLFMLALSALLALLHRFTGESDLCVGSGVANRRRPELEGLIGMVINTVALRTDLSGDPTLRELFHRVREVCLEALDHQELPFGSVVEAIQPRRSASHSPVYQVMIGSHDSPMPDFRLCGLETEIDLALSFGSSKCDLHLILIPHAEALAAERADADRAITLVWEYDTSLFEAATMTRMIDHYRQVLSAIVTDPARRLSEIDLLSEAERRRVLEEWNATDTDYPRDRTVAEVFAAEAAARPDAVALVCGDQRWTYAELERRAGRIAHHLVARGLEPGDRVGVLLDRSPDLVAALLGILEAGGAYVPLDPEYPCDRLELMLEDCRPRLLLSVSELASELPPHGAAVVLLDTEADRIAACPDQAPRIAAKATDLAYVMYTSGSTGRPKGVCVEQRGVVRLVKNTNFVALGPEEVVLCASTVSFDVSTFEIWGALLNGARLVIVPQRRPSLHDIGDAITGHGVTTVNFATPLFHEMVRANPDCLRGLHRLLAGGDVMSPQLALRAARLLADGGTVANVYGPTEGTDISSYHTISAAGESAERGVPIGRPVANTRLYVLDARGEPVPIGVPGELYIGGDGVACGYLNRPELTAERFLPDRFGPRRGGRLYRTGDLVRWRGDGALEFLGRVDRQVKVRGFRIEPGEIEAVLERHPRVESCLVLATDDGRDDRRLAAYVVTSRDDAAGRTQSVAERSPDRGPASTTAATGADRGLDGDLRPAVTAVELRGFLRRRLPDFMVPSSFTLLDAFPLAPSGKIDLAALPAPSGEPALGRPPHVAPRTATEEALSRIWCDVLGLGSVGIHDDFFDVGGHSLLAIRIAARLVRDLGARLPLEALFLHPTIADLALEVDRAEAARSYEPIVPVARRAARRAET